MALTLLKNSLQLFTRLAPLHSLQPLNDNVPELFGTLGELDGSIWRLGSEGGAQVSPDLVQALDV